MDKYMNKTILISGRVDEVCLSKFKNQKNLGIFFVYILKNLFL